MKRIFSIFMILLMLLCSSSPAVFAADNTATVSVLEDIFTRSGSVNGANVQGNSFLVVDVGRTSYFKFDVSSLRSAMTGKDAQYILQFTSHGSSAAGDVNVYGISGANRNSWTENDLSYNRAYELGLDTDVSLLIGTVTVTARNTVYTLDVTDYIQTQVPEDGIAAFKLQNKSSSAVVMIQTKEVGTGATLMAKRTYLEGTDAVFDGISLPSVAIENIDLPASGALYGSNLLWSSSDPDVISADGTVTRQNESVVVTLTATHVGYDIQRSFEIVVPGNTETTKASSFVSDDTFTRSGNHGGNVQGNNILVVDIDRTSYLKFDLSDIRAALDNKDARYTLKFASHRDSFSGTVNTYGISGDNRIGWSSETLTYNLAYANGLDTDVSNKLGSAEITAGNTVYYVDVTDYIKSVPEDGIATIKLENKEIASSVPVILQSLEGATSDEYKPVLIAERTFSELSADVFDGIEIPNAAMDNITLPTIGINGSAISWASSHPEVIAPDGTVKRQKGELLVTLTASGDGKTKSFDVIVPEEGKTGRAEIDVLENVYTRIGGYGSTVMGGAMLVVDSTRSSYLKFDVESLRTELGGKDAKYILQFTSKADSFTGKVNVYGISGTNRTGWSETTLTYDIANAMGLDTDVTNLLGETNVTARNTTYTVDVTDYIMSIPTDGIATIKLENKGIASNVPVVIQGLTGATSDEYKPKLIAERTYTDNYDKTASPRFYINGNPATEIREGIATARIAFVGDGGIRSDKGTLVIALFNGDDIESVNYVTDAFSDIYVNDMSTYIDVPDGENYHVRAFFISDFETLVPITDWLEI